MAGLGLSRRLPLALVACCCYHVAVKTTIVYGAVASRRRELPTTRRHKISTASARVSPSPKHDTPNPEVLMFETSFEYPWGATTHTCALESESSLELPLKATPNVASPTSVVLLLVSVVWFGWINQQGAVDSIGMISSFLADTARTWWNPTWTGALSAAATVWVARTPTNSTGTNSLEWVPKLFIQEMGRQFFATAWSRLEAWLSEALHMDSALGASWDALYTPCRTSQWCTSLASILWSMVKQTCRKLVVQTLVEQTRALVQAVPAVARWTRDAIRQQWWFF